MSTEKASADDGCTGYPGGYSVCGAIRDEYLRLGGPASLLGLPLTNELATPTKFGRFNHFQGGSIYWSPATGAHEVHGAIREKWASMGWENSLLGFPISDEVATPRKFGRFNHFQGGSIYWSPATGARSVHGWIRSWWGMLGWENSSMGFPMSDEFGYKGGVRENFQSGSITVASDGTIKVPGDGWGIYPPPPGCGPAYNVLVDNAPMYYQFTTEVTFRLPEGPLEHWRIYEVDGVSTIGLVTVGAARKYCGTT